ncbi:tetratricopeptide repeat protein [Acidobacteriota bacterium]
MLNSPPIWLKAVIVGVLIALAFLAFSNAFRNDFVYDDIRLIKENENLKGFTSVRLAFTADYYTSSLDPVTLGYYRPLAILLNLLDFKLWGFEPAGYHLTNTLLHAANTILVFLLIWKLALKKRLLLAGITAALFALHPIHTESVAFISGRVDPLCTLFVLAALNIYLFNTNHAKLPSPGRAFAASILFMFALFSKEMAVSLPFLFFLLLLYQLQSTHGSTLLRAARTAVLGTLWPVFTLIIYFGLRIAVLGRITSQHFESESTGILLKFLAMNRALRWNIRYLLFPPSHLNLEPVIYFRSNLRSHIILFLFNVLFFLIVIWLWRRSRLASVALLWVFITLMPVSGLISLENFVAERFLYLPSIGMCLALGVLISALCTASGSDSLTARHYALRAVGITALIGVLSVYASISLKKNALWKDEVTLWSNQLHIQPACAKAAYNLGYHYHKDGSFQDAEIYYIKAIKAAPNHYKALNNLGLLFQRQKRYTSAESVFIRAIKMEPKRVWAHYNLGNLYIEKRNLPKGIVVLKRALKLDPEHYQARANMAMALIFLGHPDEAITHFERILEKHPQERRALNGLALAKRKLKEKPGVYVPIPEDP